ncbi:MAG: tRNA lysidine(34) synthetase TilS [Smithellaceae bacterium]|nr:tRNA lysidine(34) synthetase TilS [Smithellaceae bacterium]
MIKKIEHTLRKYSLLEEGDRVLVALSGGADSCALLLVLAALAPHWRLELIAAHFNHGLRGAASDEDEAFCRRLAEQAGLVFVTQKLAAPGIPAGLSPEDYLRKERFRFLDRTAADHGAHKIALGHHRDDQAETFLLNMIRGSGLDGLKGFLPIRDNRYIRPLIEASRDEILAFLHERGAGFRKDDSNESEVYLRNRVRLELIPFLREKYNPRMEQTLARTAEIIRRDDSFIDGCVRKILHSPHIQKTQQEISFSASYFSSLHEALIYRVFKALLESLAPKTGGFSSSHLEALAGLLKEQKTGKKLSLPYGLSARREYDRIVLAAGPEEKIYDYEYPLTIPGEVDVRERRMMVALSRAKEAPVNVKTGFTFYFDGDKIREPLVIRNRRNGDWYEPLGTKGSRKIKKLFIDRKIPRRERDRIALLADRESVIWIENLHASERVKVTPETKNILVLEIRPQTDGGGIPQENI